MVRCDAIAALLVIAAGLAACSSNPIQPHRVIDDGGKVYGANKLSQERIDEIRETYIGRWFILREDWFEYAWIDTDSKGGFGDPLPATDLPYSIEIKQYVHLVAPAGTVAQITGVNSSAAKVITFIAKGEDGREFYPRLYSRRPKTISFGARNTSDRVSRVRYNDKDATLENIHYSLTHHTMEFIEAPPEMPAPPAPARQQVASLKMARPTIQALTVDVAPSYAQIGGTIELVLGFKVAAPPEATVSVRERRTVLHNGAVLPAFPVETSKVRSAGQFSTALPQTIPPVAAPGRYTFRGDVCVLGDCISRSVDFEVLPP